MRKHWLDAGSLPSAQYVYGGRFLEVHLHQPADSGISRININLVQITAINRCLCPCPAPVIDARTFEYDGPARTHAGSTWGFVQAHRLRWLLSAPANARLRCAPPPPCEYERLTGTREYERLTRTLPGVEGARAYYGGLWKGTVGLGLSHGGVNTYEPE